jgi:hypothetical protein
VSALISKAAYIAIDLDCVSDSDHEAVSALQSLEMMSSARIILLSEQNQKSGLLARAARAGFVNIVSAEDAETEQMELRLCIEGEGMSRQQAQRYLLPMEETDSRTENKKRIIGVCGAIHRTGTTSTALQMAAHLTAKGQSACLIEANHHGHIATLSHAYQIEKEADGALNCGGLMLYPSCLPSFRPQKNYDALCFDFGMLEEITPEIFGKCDIQIVCSGVKPWESHWLQLLFDCAETLSNLHFIFHFVPSDDQADVRRLMEKFADRCYFAPPSPNLFDGRACAAIFDDILSKKPTTKHRRVHVGKE